MQGIRIGQAYTTESSSNIVDDVIVLGRLGRTSWAVTDYDTLTHWSVKYSRELLAPSTLPQKDVKEQIEKEKKEKKERQEKQRAQQKEFFVVLQNK